MNVVSIRNNAAALFTMLLVATGARAEYRCDEPSTPIDKRACEAAKESPEALRRFIQRMRVVEHLQFGDYVNAATEVAWDQARERNRQASKAVASSQNR